MQGVQERMPVERRHGQAQVGGDPPGPSGGEAVPPGEPAGGARPDLEPGRLGLRPAVERDPEPPGLQAGARSPGGDRPPPDLAPVRARPPPQVVPPPRARPPRRGARDGRPARRLFHHLQRAAGRPRGGRAFRGRRVQGRAGRDPLLRPSRRVEGDARPGLGPRPPERRSARPARPQGNPDPRLRAELRLDVRRRVPRLPARARRGGPGLDGPVGGLVPGRRTPRAGPRPRTA